MSFSVRGYMLAIIPILLVAIAGTTYVLAPHARSEEIRTQTPDTQTTPVALGKRVIVNLSSMTTELRDGDTLVASFPIVSKGKPGSYYETPGGNYVSDYKEPLHFSSIGHVYMPLSVHVFGNFFIHGIPYYPDGTRVASTYSGGCIRLEDTDAHKVYEFVERGTPIIITQEERGSFMEEPSYTAQPIESMDMTRLMAAAISLEFLTQDDTIIFQGSSTTRRTLLPTLLQDHNDDVIDLYASHLGTATLVATMNKKASSLNLSHTVFSGHNKPALTTPEDLAHFMQYMHTYKSYLTNQRK